MMCECWSCRVFVLFTYSPKIWTGMHSISIRGEALMLCLCLLQVNGLTPVFKCLDAFMQEITLLGHVYRNKI